MCEIMKTDCYKLKMYTINLQQLLEQYNKKDIDNKPRKEIKWNNKHVQLIQNKVGKEEKVNKRQDKQK